MASFSVVKAQNISKAVFRISGSAPSPIRTIEVTIGRIEFAIDGDGNLYSKNTIDGGQYDYWTNDSFGNRDGKVKSIGNINVDYWTNDSYGNRTGKIKSIGNINVDYWTNDSFGNRDGKVKSVTGNMPGVYVYSIGN
jgi:hypothetical protein